jgi:predicted ATP-dependent Lon-type protease
MLGLDNARDQMSARGDIPAAPAELLVTLHTSFYADSVDGVIEAIGAS